jgi:transcription elongation factor GreA
MSWPNLKVKGRAEIARQLAEARDKGDLSENAEYDAAKDAQGHLELKIAKLEEVVGNARLIDDSNLDLEQSTDPFESEDQKPEQQHGAGLYVLVSEEEANLAAGKFRLNHRSVKVCWVKKWAM